MSQAVSSEDFYWENSDEITFMECDKFEVHIPCATFERLEAVAFRDGYNISWLLRTILVNPFEFEVPEKLKRPKKFEQPMHRFPICFYGADKRLWKMKMAAMESEFGAYLRYLLDLYDQYLEVMDLGESLVCEAEDIEKEFGTVSGCIGYGYQLLMWVKNSALTWRTGENHMNNRIKMLFGRHKVRFSRTAIKSMLRDAGHT